MTTRSSGPCRWKALAASIAATCAPCGLAAALPTSAGPPDTGGPGVAVPSMGAYSTADWTMDAPAPAGAQELYLEVWLNQSRTGRPTRFVAIDGRLHASAATLRELGLRWPGSESATGLVPLDGIPGLQARYDAGRQQLALSAPLDALSDERAHYAFAERPTPRVDPSTRAAGLLFNYDVYAQGNGDYRSVSGWHELRLFGAGPGLWSNSAVSRMSSAPGRNDLHETVRLDTNWQLDLPDSMVSVAVGDAFTSALDWTRPTRFGGVRASRNFALQPYRVTTPLASFAGDATLPSSVDLYINGIRQSREQVRPGQFQIDRVPMINGAGQAQMVITDINGQSRVLDFSLYGSSELLQRGLTDWSMETGWVRREYGIESFSYADDPMASATLRHGLSDSLTVETHAEGTADLQMAGVGARMLLGSRGGVLDASAAGSRVHDRSGHQYGGGWQWSSPRLSLGLATLRRSDDFADVASLEGSLLPLRSDRFFGGISLGNMQVSTSYVRQDYPTRPRARYANLWLSWQLRQAGYFSFSLSRNLDVDRSDSAYLYWSRPLDRRQRTSMSATMRHAGDVDNLTLEAHRNIDFDRGGWGWRSQATMGDQSAAQAEVSQLGRYGGWNAGAFYYRGENGAVDSTTGYASARGSVLLMERHLFAMRRVDDAFALVSTDGIADVPVLLENRPIGRTDEHGLLLLNRLNAWQNNRLSIDPLQVPVDVSLEHTELMAVPENRSGVLVRFPMRPSLSLQFSVSDATGRPIAAGSEVWLQGADPLRDPALTVVGFDGLVYLENPPRDARLMIRQKDGFCEVQLPAVPVDRGQVQLEGTTCR